MGKSEFGKGLVICLIKFTEHFENQMFTDLRYSSSYAEGEDIFWDGKELYESSLKIWGTSERLISSKITSWANGATDHLYEIECPDGNEWANIRGEVNKLQKLGLDMRHESLDKIYKYEDVLLLWNLANKIALMIDRKIGLNPDKGVWQ